MKLLWFVIGLVFGAVSSFLILNVFQEGSSPDGLNKPEPQATGFSASFGPIIPSKKEKPSSWGDDLPGGPEELFDLGFRLAREGGDWRGQFGKLTRAAHKASFIAGVAAGGPPQTWDSLAVEFRGLPPGIVRDAALVELSQAMAISRPKDAISMAQQALSGPSLNNAISGIAEIWGSNRLEDALLWGINNPNDPIVSQVIEMAAGGAADSDPSAALAAVSQATSLSSELRSIALRSILGLWALDDPIAAFSWARDYGQQYGDDAPAQSALLNWATQDPASATKTAAGLDDSLANQVLPETVSMWAAEDPADAARWVSSQNYAVSSRAEAIDSVAETWAQLDSKGALDWALALPTSDPSRPSAIQTAALVWERFDPAGLKAYTQTNPSAFADVRSVLSQAEAPEGD